MLRASSRTNFFGIRFISGSDIGALHTTYNALDVSEGIGIHMHFLNAHSLNCAHDNPELQTILRESNSLNIPDGAGVVLLSRLLYGERLNKLRGPDFFKQSMNDPDFPEGSIFLIGVRSDVVQAIEKILSERNPPTFVKYKIINYGKVSEAESKEIIREIKEANSKFIFLGIGTPYQDFLAREIAREVPAICVCVGVAFDFYAGFLPESPKILQRMGLEWLFRLGCEPKRLFRRYIFGIPKFIILSIISRLSAPKA